MSEQPKLVQTAPERLWLCVSNEAADMGEAFPKDLSEVTWAVGECPVAAGVQYVRADELARLRKMEKSARDAGMLTEDGVLITPGVQVWVPGKRPVDDVLGNGAYVIGNIDHPAARGHLLSAFRVGVGQPYSTREAAEAARKGEA